MKPETEMLLKQSDASTDHKEGRRVLFEIALATLSRLTRADAEHAVVLEVGVGGGGSSLALMAAIVESRVPWALVTVDPYHPNRDSGAWALGNFYHHKALSYQARRLVTEAAIEHDTPHTHYPMRDTDYMSIWGSVPHCVPGMAPIERPGFAFVHLDGGHEMESEKRQVAWVVPRLIAGGNVLVDDVSPGRADQLGAWLKEKYGGRMVSEVEWVLR